MSDVMSGVSIEEAKAVYARRAARFGIPAIDPATAAVEVAARAAAEGPKQKIAAASVAAAARAAAAAAARVVTRPLPLVTGFNALNEERRLARGIRFGLAWPIVDFVGAAATAAGLGSEEIAVRKERRKRADRFGQPDPLDVAIARAALVAVEADFVAVSVAVGGPDAPAIRPEALHLRGVGYLPASTGDIYAWFGDLRPSAVAWLNGVSVVAIFADAGSCARALAALTEPVPSAAGVAPVWVGWRVALKPLVKGRTDRYAPAGTETTLFVRQATALDTKENAPGTTGPSTHGTFSRSGEYSLRRVTGTAMDEDNGEIASTAAVAGLGAPPPPAAAGEAGDSGETCDAVVAFMPEEPVVEVLKPAPGPPRTRDGKIFLSAAVRDLDAAQVASSVVAQLREAAVVVRMRDHALPGGAQRRAQQASEPAAPAFSAPKASADSDACATIGGKRRRYDGVAGDASPGDGGAGNSTNLDDVVNNGEASGTAEAAPATKRVRGRGTVKAPTDL